MITRPLRIDLVSSVVDALKHSIESGEWENCLPSERKLCRELQIGRSTLRKALLILEQNRTLKIAHGKRTKILKIAVHKKQRNSTTVAAIVKGSPEAMDTLTSWRLNDLQYDLYAAGMTLNIYAEGNEIRGLSSLHIEKLLATHKAACWIVFAGNQHIQNLFFKSGVPAFLVGTPHPGIDLPYIDIDFRTACRHATGQLLRLGHRNIVLISRNVKFPGTLASLEGFQEAVDQHTGNKVAARIIKFDEDTHTIAPLLNKMLANPSRPTAIITISAELALMVLTTILSLGLSVPKDISLISRDYRPFLKYTNPPIMGYEVNHSLFRKKLRKSLLELIDIGRVTSRAGLVIPELTGQSSMAPPPPPLINRVRSFACA